MALKYLRRYQRKILIVVAIVVIPAFVLLYGGSRQSTGSAGGGARVVGTIGEDPVRSSEFGSFRSRLQRIRGLRVDDVEDVDERVKLVLQQLALVREAEAVGLVASKYELWEFMRERIKQMARLQPNDRLTRKRLQETLHDYRISETAFQQAARETIISAELARYVRDGALAPTEDRYLEYCERNSKLRVLYRDFPVADHLEQVEKPTDEEIQTHFDKNTGLSYGKPLALYEPEGAVLEILFAEHKAFERHVKVTEALLQKHYDRTKNRYKIAEPAPAGNGGEQAEEQAGGAEAEPAYKPFAEVKGEVETDYRRTKAPAFARKACKDAKREHDKRLKALKEKAQAARAESANDDDDNPPPEDGDGEPPVQVDLKDLAAQFKLTYTRTEILTAEDLKNDEGSEPFGSLASIRFLAFDKARREELTAGLSESRRAGPFAKGTGMLVFRIAEFREAKKWTFEQAKPAIVGRLIQGKAEKAADELAKAFKENLDERDEGGEQKVDLNALTDTGMVKPYHEVARWFRGKPTGQSEIMRPPAEDEKKKVVRVGILVARENPTREAFQKDFSTQAPEPSWKRDLRGRGRTRAWDWLEFSRKRPIRVAESRQTR